MEIGKSNSNLWMLFMAFVAIVAVIANTTTIASFFENQGWIVLKALKAGAGTPDQDQNPPSEPSAPNPESDRGVPPAAPKSSPLLVNLYEKEGLHVLEFDPKAYSPFIGKSQEPGFLHPVDELIGGAEIAVPVGFYSPEHSAMIGSLWQKEGLVYQDPTGPEAGCMLTLGPDCMHVSKPLEESQVPFDGLVSIQTGPQLLPGTSGGEKFLPHQEGYKKLLEVKYARRVAIGKIDSNRFVVAISNSSMSLSDFREALDKLGCKLAINLDGGSSAFLWFEGRFIVPPNKHLPFVLCFKRR